MTNQQKSVSEIAEEIVDEIKMDIAPYDLEVRISQALQSERTRIEELENKIKQLNMQIVNLKSGSWESIRNKELEKCLGKCVYRLDELKDKKLITTAEELLRKGI